MSGKDKTKAAANRTLTLSESEIADLQAQLCDREDLRKAFHDNMIINGDLFDCIDLIPD